MIPSPLAVAYFLAIVTGGLVSVLHGRRSERLIMAAIAAEWTLTYPTWFLSALYGYGVPVLPYLCVDAFIALIIIEFMLEKEWQLIVARLAVLHVVIHMVFYASVNWVGMPSTNRPYADILTGLGYLEIGVTIWAATHHEWRTRSDPQMARHRYRALIPGFALFSRRSPKRGHFST